MSLRNKLLKLFRGRESEDEPPGRVERDEDADKPDMHRRLSEAQQRLRALEVQAEVLSRRRVDKGSP
jgi:hypothetical protein